MKPFGFFLATLVICASVFSDIHYVSPFGSAVAPYTTWATAATHLQAAVDAASAGDTVLVTNGTYLLSAEISVSKNITIESVNGREMTLVDGQDTVRCFNLGSSLCTLRGFTIQNGRKTNGNGGGIFCNNSLNPLIIDCLLKDNDVTGNSPPTDGLGGGVYYGTLRACTLSGNSASFGGGGAGFSSLSNCVLSGNSAGNLGGGSVQAQLDRCQLIGNSAEFGGGSGFDTLNNCLLFGNEANFSGGGSSDSTLNNCTVIGNTAVSDAGGCENGILKNCIVWSNSAPFSPNWFGSSISYSCTTPLPGGTGNITNAPSFIDEAGGNYRLGFGSECIDAGNPIIGLVEDLDGNLRPVDGNFDSTATYDMGAYEYTPAVYDADGDGFSDLVEQIADTGILDSNDWFQISSISNNTVFFQSSENRQYTLQFRTDLVEGAWSNITGQVDVMGNGGEDSLTDSTANNAARFYRVQVEIP